MFEGDYKRVLPKVTVNLSPEPRHERNASNQSRDSSSKRRFKVEKRTDGHFIKLIRNDQAFKDYKQQWASDLK